MKDPEDTDYMTMTFNPSDADSLGIIYLSEPGDSKVVKSITASRVSIKKISGPANIFFDFVGKESLI